MIKSQNFRRVISMGPQSYVQTKRRCQKLQERVGDYLIKVHCDAHNLELAAAYVLTKEKKQAMEEVETALKGVSVSSKPKSATWPDIHSKMC